MWNDPTTVQPLLCLPCIVERKTAEQNATPPAQLPEMRPAVTLMQSPLGPVTPHCLEHIAVQTQSPLMIPGQVLAGRPG